MQTIANDVHVLRAKKSQIQGSCADAGGSEEQAVEMRWERIPCTGNHPPEAYGHTIITVAHHLYGHALASYGGVTYGG